MKTPFVVGLIMLTLLTPTVSYGQEMGSTRVGFGIDGIIGGSGGGLGAGAGARIELSEGAGRLIWSVSRDQLWALETSADGGQRETANFTQLAVNVTLSPLQSRTRLFAGAEVGRFKSDADRPTAHVGLIAGTRSNFTRRFDIVFAARGRKGSALKLLQFNAGIAYPTTRGK